MNEALDKILKAATGTKEQPASPWTGVLYVFLALLVVALAALPAILARRRAAQIAHERDVLLEEQHQRDVLAVAAELREEAQVHMGKADQAGLCAQALEKELEELQEKRQAFEAAMSTITTWEDLETQ